MDRLKLDLLYAFRNLVKSPGYAIVTILTLALGIGANTAIFSVVNGVILKPLSFSRPERLVFITSQFPNLGFDQFWVSSPEFLEFRERNQSFQDVGAYTAGAVNLGTQDQPRRVNSAVITSELMPVLGSQPIRGRVFNRQDTLPGAEDVGILSSEIWETAFARDETVVGRVIPVDGIPTRIVGVMPPGFDVHDQKVQVWLPLTLDPAKPGNRGGHFLYLVGRLKDGVTMAQARADLESMLINWANLNPKTHVPNQKTHRLRFDGLQDDMIGAIRSALWVLQGAVGFVLLIACANLANLLLARAESRQREFAIRSALGAGRGRILRQFLTEGVLLALIGGAVGMALAYGGLRALLAADPDSIPRSADISLDPIVLTFTLLVSVVTGVLFGMAPLINLRQQAVTMTLKESGQRSTAGGARARVRSGLVAAEVALAVVLVIGAGLLLRSFWNLMSVDAGFSRSKLSTFGLVLPTTTYQNNQSRIDFFTRLNAQLRQIPGVQGTTAMTGLPPFRQVNANDTNIDGYTAPPDGPFENMDYYQTVTLDYLKTLGIPITDGRDFTLADVTGAPAVLVNETLAKTFFKGAESGWPPSQTWVQRRNALVQHRRRREGRQAGWSQLQDRDRGLLPRGTDRGPQPFCSQEHERRGPVRAAARRAGAARSAVSSNRWTGRCPSSGSGRWRTCSAHPCRGRGCWRSCSASSPDSRFCWRPSERMASWLTPSRSGRRKSAFTWRSAPRAETCSGKMLGQGMRLTGLGLVVGLAAAVGLTRLLQTQLFNVKPTDPLTMSAVAGVISLVAFIACYIPASRATRVDPMVVLRDE